MTAAPAVYEAQALDALAAVEARPPDAYLWFGRRVGLAPPAGRAALVGAIGDALHEGFFGAAVAQPRRGGPVTAPDEGGSFARALAQANCGRGSWQPGWRVAEVREEAVAVVRPDGLRLLAPPEDCRIDGALAAVRVPKEQAGGGTLRALGDAAPPAGDLLALYWNVGAPGAVTLVARATYALNGAGLPFWLETPAEPARYARGAAAVLVLARADLAAAMALLRPLVRALSAHMSDGAPAFTRPLARGLALAEEPGGGQGFGAHRCALLAEAVVTARERGLHAPAERLAVTREVFERAGISLAAPYLQPGSADAYDRS